MNRSQAYALLRGIAGESEGVKNAAYGVVLDLMEQTHNDPLTVDIEPPRWDRNDPTEWADPPDERTGPPINPSYIDLLNERTKLRAELTEKTHACERWVNALKDAEAEHCAVLQAARKVTQSIDRADRLAAIAHLADIVGGTTREDTA